MPTLRTIIITATRQQALRSIVVTATRQQAVETIIINRGPKGAKGDQGDTGPAGADSTVPGPQGPQGPAGTTSWSGITDKPLSFTPDLTGVSPGDIGAATAAQGALADTAVQPEALLSANVSHADTAAEAAALTNGTIAGTTTFSGGDAAQFRTALGAGTAGNEIFQATTYTGAGSVRRLMGLDTTDEVGFLSVSVAGFGISKSATSTLSFGGVCGVHSAGVKVLDTKTIGFVTNMDSGIHTGLSVDSLYILAQKSGTNAQTYRIYGTTTGNKYLQLTHNGVNAKITASSGDLHISNIPTSNPGPGILWNDGGVLKIGT